MMMVKIFLLVLGVTVLATAGVTDHLNHGNSHAGDDVNKPSQEVPAPMCSIPPPVVNQLKDIEKKDADCSKASQQVYIDCKDAYSKGQRTSQVYTINPDYGVPFQAYCNMDIDGGGWTVLVRQRNGSFGFNRSRKDHVNGFGDLNGEHWLGLEKVHRLTKTISLLRVDVTSYTQGSKYVKYNEFKMGPAPNYAQYFSNYSGNIDSLQFHDGVKFDIKSDHGRVVCGEYNLNGVQYKQCVRIDGKRIFSALGFFEGKTRRR